VVDTVRQWIAYLGSTLELEAALRKLKDWVELGNGAGITKETDANKLLADFFRTEAGASAVLDSAVDVGGRRRPKSFDRREVCPHEEEFEERLVRRALPS
jgi:hypothetical protein